MSEEMKYEYFIFLQFHDQDDVKKLQNMSQIRRNSSGS